MINKIYLDKNVESSMISGNEALSLMLNSNMAVHQLHRNAEIVKQSNLYPAYNNIKSSKLLCYPNSMIFTDILQAYLCKVYVTIQHKDFVKFKMMFYI